MKPKSDFRSTDRPIREDRPLLQCPRIIVFCSFGGDKQRLVHGGRDSQRGIPTSSSMTNRLVIRGLFRKSSRYQIICQFKVVLFSFNVCVLVQFLPLPLLLPSMTFGIHVFHRVCSIFATTGTAISRPGECVKMSGLRRIVTNSVRVSSFENLQNLQKGSKIFRVVSSH